MQIKNPLTRIDFYKADHRSQYPDNTSKIYSNFTSRASRMKGVNEIVFFGLQYFILKFLIHDFNNGFFNRPLEEVMKRYQRRLDNALGKGVINTDHIAALHKLGYLPLCIKALPEGTLVPLKVPCMTIYNTRDEEFWLVNYLETILSNYIWKPCTSATIAREYRINFEKYYRETVGDASGAATILWQGHDFSARGMSFEDDAAMSGLGHLLSFYGTDTVWAIDYAEDYYFADSDKEMIGGSIPATEHSVMCMGGKEGELETVRRLITQVYPSGPIAIVWDTWDYWGGIRNILPQLKNEIMLRTGHPLGLNKVVIRPDTGNPYRIIVGYFDNELQHTSSEIESERVLFINENGNYQLRHTDVEITPDEKAGSVQLLWDIFGGSTTAEGYHQLAPQIGLIYGDSITLERQIEILEGLKQKNFASTNVVLGIGSFTYEYVTRDTFGSAMKATYGELTIDGEIEEREIFKDPKTDGSGMKKSAKGLLRVDRDENTGKLVLKDQCTWEEEQGGLLETVFLNGKILRVQTFEDIRKVVASEL